jgi:DNA-binding CsgD family transcriptional regulator
MQPSENLESKIDTLIRINAIQLIGEKTGSEAIALLRRAGLSTELIADVVGTTPATVRSAKARERTKGSVPRRVKKGT